MFCARCKSVNGECGLLHEENRKPGKENLRLPEKLSSRREIEGILPSRVLVGEIRSLHKSLATDLDLNFIVSLCRWHLCLGTKILLFLTYICESSFILSMPTLSARRKTVSSSKGSNNRTFPQNVATISFPSFPPKRISFWMPECWWCAECTYEVSSSPSLPFSLGEKLYQVPKTVTTVHSATCGDCVLSPTIYN